MEYTEILDKHIEYMNEQLNTAIERTDCVRTEQCSWLSEDGVCICTDPKECMVVWLKQNIEYAKALKESYVGTESDNG